MTGQLPQPKEPIRAISIQRGGGVGMDYKVKMFWYLRSMAPSRTMSLMRWMNLSLTIL